jgi:hypothetical protein
LKKNASNAIQIDGINARRNKNVWQRVIVMIGIYKIGTQPSVGPIWIMQNPRDALGCALCHFPHHHITGPKEGDSSAPEEQDGLGLAVSTMMLQAQIHVMAPGTRVHSILHHAVPTAKAAMNPIACITH